MTKAEKRVIKAAVRVTKHWTVYSRLLLWNAVAAMDIEKENATKRDTAEHGR